MNESLESTEQALSDLHAGIRPGFAPRHSAVLLPESAERMLRMAAPITVVGNAIEPGAPVMLFPTRIVGGGVDTLKGRQYDVALDGRVLINTELPGDAAPITLIQHWNPEAKK